MDELKLCCKDEDELEGLSKIFEGFSDDICMDFRLSKRSKATFKRGKLEKFDNVRLDEETMIKDLDQEKKLTRTLALICVVQLNRPQ